MRNHLFRIVCALALAFALPAIAATDVSGKWHAEFTTPDGTTRTADFTFKADGDKLTGTVAGAQDETAIKDGTISGDTISFTAERPFGTFTYKGTVNGDEIKLKVTFNENTFDIVAKRVK